MKEHWIRAALLNAFALLIVYLHHTNQLLYYIEPGMSLYVKLSSIGLLAAGTHQIYAALQRRSGNSTPSCDCGHDHEHPSHRSKPLSRIKKWLVYSLFLLPLILPFVMPGNAPDNASARLHAHQH
ncbi:DUF1980 domain-containing protein [Paenibacillus sp. NEAU-GSW1]|uniref:DUF1980 domain-containing protein n=1 Tax=Paenibacillus sp. NEAU-GSW1 TaxID=2682486 RepID=UPI0012E1AE53|nr:DUF1980 domain-containing protein [Paenibacillus sp. NEAU-GSW1]MUT67574.1 DUF1980 domain-containing protein [Paenibacillus sp. NEAU-GSW1]